MNSKTIELKPLGVIRNTDQLGRVVIPAEIRKINGWETNQPLEMFADDDGGIYIKAYGRESVKKDVLANLKQLQKSVDGQAVLEVVKQAIDFIENRGQ